MAPKPRGERSKYHRLLTRTLSRAEKGQIAEAAVLLRITLLGLPVYSSVFDGGGSTDWVVEVPSGKLLKLQVKWTSTFKHGLPLIKLRCSAGRAKERRYKDNEFDFVIGYDLYTDTAYVFGRDEVADHRTAVTIREDAAEKWEKITGA